MDSTRFSLPEKVKPLKSKATERVYKTYLNRLALFDIDSVEKILMYPDDVVSIIKDICSMTDGEENAKQEARIYYSAVFFVLYGHPILEDPHNPLRLGFQACLPSKTSKGEDWKPSEQYKNTPQ